VAKPPGRILSYFFRVLGLFFLGCFPVLLFAQAPDLTPVIPPPAPPPSKHAVNAPGDVGKDEITTQDSFATLKVRVNLVLVRVVVRDSQGNFVTNLKKEDFQLFDNRKPQVISSFSVETPDSRAVEEAAGSSEGNTASIAPKTVALPQRYVALFFDDLHLAAQDVMVTQAAATKLIAALPPTGRISIFTTSGQVEQDFTADRQKLEETLRRIGPRGMTSHSAEDCPPVTFYEAYQIIEVQDSLALQVAVQDALACGASPQAAPVIAKGAARRELATGEAELQFSFSNLDSLLRRMGALPGERSIVLMSPGFFVTPSMRQSSDMIDRAARNNIVINTLDARGLFVSSAESDFATHRCQSPECQSFIRTEETLQDDVLAELADGTGGLFIHNRNDLDTGLIEAAAEPEASYVLGFSPSELKFDGKYHHLKVSLTNKEKFTLQARHGYFAPAKAIDPAVEANEELQQAIYSREEPRDLPIACETQFFENGHTVRLSVSARVDLRGLNFRKVEDRNIDHLTVATVVFDENGNLVTGLQREIDMKLKDATLEHLRKTGISVKSDFTIQPGTYLVRLVVRDSEGARMAALDRAVVIP
jgi:VWFA-related protein